MITMDIFNDNAFTAVSLTEAIKRLEYIPNQLATLPGLFIPDPVRTEVIWIEQSAEGYEIINFSPRGAPPHQTGGDPRNARAFRTLRIADASRITASELLGIRAEGSETELKMVQTEVATRQRKLMGNSRLTREYHMFNCVTEAKVLDKAGNTIYDWATEFGLSIPAEVDFDLDNGTPAAGAIRKKTTAMKRSIDKALLGRSHSRIIGLCGDAFFDDLVSNPEVEKLWINWNAAAQARSSEFSDPWRTFSYSGVDYVNYRGKDDGTFGVHTDKCKFFPVGAGIFRWAMSPGERMEHVGTMGQNFYSNIVRDKDRDQWVDIEVYSYPLPVCTFPNALYQARRT